MHRKIKIIFLAIILINSLTSWSATHHPQDFLQNIAHADDEGKQIVEHFCINCHASNPLIPLGAPRMGIIHDWQERLKQNIDVLFKNTSEGINAMPARGGCFECTDRQLVEAILMLLPESAQKEKRNALIEHIKNN